MPVILAKNWWSLVIRGSIAVLLGILTFLLHDITLGRLALLFGGYAVIDGLVGFAGAVRAAEAHQSWAVLLIEGLAGIVAGSVALGWPGITLLSLEYVIAAWALITGTLEIAAAMRLRTYVPGEWLLGLSGAASLVLGILMIALPLAGTLNVRFWIGGYSLLFGALLLGLGSRLRNWVPAPAVLNDSQARLLSELHRAERRH